jgi:hypothetical protein
MMARRLTILFGPAETFQVVHLPIRFPVQLVPDEYYHQMRRS